MFESTKRSSMIWVVRGCGQPAEKGEGRRPPNSSPPWLERARLFLKSCRVGMRPRGSAGGRPSSPRLGASFLSVLVEPPPGATTQRNSFTTRTVAGGPVHVVGSETLSFFQWSWSLCTDCLPSEKKKEEKRLSGELVDRQLVHEFCEKETESLHQSGVHERMLRPSCGKVCPNAVDGGQEATHRHSICARSRLVLVQMAWGSRTDSFAEVWGWFSVLQTPCGSRKQLCDLHDVSKLSFSRVAWWRHLGLSSRRRKRTRSCVATSEGTVRHQRSRAAVPRARATGRGEDGAHGDTSGSPNIPTRGMTVVWCCRGICANRNRSNSSMTHWNNSSCCCRCGELAVQRSEDQLRTVHE